MSLLPDVWMFRLAMSPKAQSRHRCRVWQGRVLTYDPCAKDKKKLAMLLQEQMEREKARLIADKPVSISIWFYLYNARPKVVLYKRPDLDNLVKFVLDSANGVLFADDAQICRIMAQKAYVDKKENECIILTIREINDEVDTSDAVKALSRMR